MRQFFRFGLLWIIFSIQPCYAQTVLYKNYGVKDGLAGSTVYHSFQDKRGFMWFGTDQGLSRFDGTNFKNFTTQDGLPDNEVFRVSEDTLGRLWMICYNSKPCFMYQGIIHNSNNDSLLQKIDAENRLFRGLNADKEGRMWILGVKIYLVDGNKVQKFNTPDQTEVMSVGYIDNRLSVVTSKAVYEMKFENDTISYKLFSNVNATNNNSACFFRNECYIIQLQSAQNSSVIKVTNESNLRINLFSSGISDLISGHLVYNPLDSVILISAGVQGIKAFNRSLILQPDPYPFLPHDISYSFTSFDAEGNTWIASLGRGVFFIPAHKTLQYKLNEVVNSPNATSVYKTKNGSIYVGFDYSHYGILKDGKLMVYTIVDSEFSSRNRLIRLCSLNEDHILLGSDYGIYIVSTDKPAKYQLIDRTCVKNIINEGDDSVLVGGIKNAFRLINTEVGFQSDTLWDARTTAITKDHSGKIWMGSLQGLFFLANGNVKRFDKNELINKSRITDLLNDEYDNIWVATNQRGVFIITKDSIINVNTTNGLPSDACVRLFKESQGVIWVCTSRYVSKISFGDSDGFRFDVSTLGELTGEVDVLVNDVLADSANIWIATSDGLLQIEKREENSSISPPAYITSFKASDSVLTDINSLRLKYFQNNIQIDYIGLSYNSGGKIIYKYLLNAPSTDTVFTRNTTLNFNSLLPGKYSFQVWAKNITGVWSEKPATLYFEITPPYWKTWWFTSLLLLTVTLGIWIVVRRRILQIKIQESEKTRINKKIAEVELQAVRAQMNEHFIFNSLNSIQNFINQNNTEAANFYLANFGKLIRRTLDISTMPAISLQDEMDYLNNYLTLEKMRFEDKFDYSISNEIESTAPNYIVFPSMILQPYVENAIKHGLRYKTEGKGNLKIYFTIEGKFIVSWIEDNGIGRENAQEMKSKVYIDYQSKGMQLSEDRIYLFNRANDNKIKVEIVDKENSTGKALGTLVKVYVPFKTSL